MFNLSDGVKKALILIPTQLLPTGTRVSLRREHLARLETLELQREAARAQIEAAERIAEIEAEISRLRRLCDLDC